MTSPKKIACIGEVMIELVARKDRQATIGVAGDTYNTAVYISKLASTSSVNITYVTALGTDQFSKRILNEITRHGILSDHIEYRSTHMPGLYAIDTDENGERSFSYWRGQSAARTLFQEPCEVTFDRLEAFDLIYVSGITMAILPPETRWALIDFLTEYRKLGGKFAFDSNYRPRLWEAVETARETTMAMWSITDIALPSLDDEMELFEENTQEDVLKRLRNIGVKYGALKRGINGPYALDETASPVAFEKITNMVDTTAAGDSFNAGFLYQYAIGNRIEDALLTGHELASKVIQQSGAIIELDK